MRSNARGVAMFFLLSYAIAWTGFLLVYATGSANQPLFIVFAPLVTFAPAVAALIVNRMDHGADAAHRTFAPLARWRFPAGWYVFIFSWYPIARLLAFSLGSHFHSEPMRVEYMNPVLIA